MPASLNCLKLPVFTQTGIYLGRVVGVEVDATASQVIYYQIKKTPRWYFLDKNEFLINPRQVLSLSLKKMVVQDAVNQGTKLEIKPMIEPSL